MNIKLNPKWTKEEQEQFKIKIKENNGYCPCMLLKTKDEKCMCKNFRNKIKDDTFYGECHCGLYVKEK